jgi:hypothetical protein
VENVHKNTNTVKCRKVFVGNNPIWLPKEIGEKMLATDSKSRRYRSILALALYGYALGVTYTADRYVEAYPAYDTTFDIISVVACVVVASAIFGYNVGTRHLRPCGECEYRNAEQPHTLCRECAQVVDEYYYYEPEATNKRRFFNK